MPDGVLLADGGLGAQTAAKLVDALTLGSLYALIAVGYTMVYGIIKLINFAHGEIYMLGAYWALLVLLLFPGSGLLLAIIPAMVLCAAVGVSVDWTAYLSLRRRLPLADSLSVLLLVALSLAAVAYKLTGETTSPWFDLGTQRVLLVVLCLFAVAILGLSIAEKTGSLGRSRGDTKSDRLSALITAIGMSLILQQLVMLIGGADYKAFDERALPVWFGQVFQIGPLAVLGKELIIWVVAILMMIGLQLLVSKTKIGKAMRACASDKEAARLMGISVDKVIGFTFLVGSAMAAVAGILYAAKVGGNISFRMGYYPGLLAFAAAVLGGIGNIRGAMLGGLLIGLVQGFTDPGVFTWPFLVMIVVLLVRPWGILGTPETKRA